MVNAVFPSQRASDGECPISSVSIKSHDDVIKWKYFPRYWPFARRIHRSPVDYKRLSKQSRRRLFEMPSHSLWRHCNVSLLCTIQCRTTFSVLWWTRSLKRRKLLVVSNNRSFSFLTQSVQIMTLNGKEKYAIQYTMQWILDFSFLSFLFNAGNASKKWL